MNYLTTPFQKHRSYRVEYYDDCD